MLVLREHTYYGHGLWIHDEGGEDREEYIMGYDAGAWCHSGTHRAKRMQISVLSNTTRGAWPVLKDIYAAIEG